MTEDVPPVGSEVPAPRVEKDDVPQEISLDDGDEASTTTELVEVFPNVVAVLGEVPTELGPILEPPNAGLLSNID